MFQATNGLLKALLTFLAEHAVAGPSSGTLDLAQVGLFTNNPTVNENTVVGDLTQPTYPGYALTTIGAWTTPFKNEAGDWQMSAPPILFQMDDDTVPTVITGAFIVKAGDPTALLGVTVFDETRSLVSADDGCEVEVEMALSAEAFNVGPNVD